MAIAREPAANYVPRVQEPLLSPASPIRTRIAYLVLRILCLRYKRIQKRSSPSSAGNSTVRLLVGSRKALRIRESGRQRDEENCHVIRQGRHRLRHGVPLSAHSSKPESLSLSKTAKANRR